MKPFLLGFDIGGTKCAVLIGKRNGDDLEIIDRREFLTQTAKGPAFALASMEEAAKAALGEHGIEPGQIHGAGISCGGPLDNQRGVILSPPNLPGWDEIAIRDRFEASLGVQVRLENDADACAVAEWMWGAGERCQNMVFLTFGTGMGAGLILNGHLYTGAHGLAGEVGHVRLAKDGPVGYGKRGSFEGFCSGGGIAQLAATVVAEHQAHGVSVPFYEAAGSPSEISARAVAEAAQQGDPVALEIFETVALHLGEGLAILVDILDPDKIVIGSIFARCQELLLPIASSVLQREIVQAKGRNVAIVPAALGDQVGDYACLALAAKVREDT